jgi:hypothetical protein
MDHFNFKNGELYCEDVPVARIADEVGTPAYVYSKATPAAPLPADRRGFRAGQGHRLLQPSKAAATFTSANSSPSRAAASMSPAAANSYRVLAAGGDPKEDHLCRRRQDRRGNRRGHEGRHRRLQRRIRSRDRNIDAVAAPWAKRPSPRCASIPTSIPKRTATPPPERRKRQVRRRHRTRRARLRPLPQSARICAWPAFTFTSARPSTRSSRTSRPSARSSS